MLNFQSKFLVEFSKESQLQKSGCVREREREREGERERKRERERERERERGGERERRGGGGAPWGGGISKWGTIWDISGGRLQAWGDPAEDPPGNVLIAY